MALEQFSINVHKKIDQAKWADLEMPCANRERLRDYLRHERYSPYKQAEKERRKKKKKSEGTTSCKWPTMPEEKLLH